MKTKLAFAVAVSLLGIISQARAAFVDITYTGIVTYSNDPTSIFGCTSNCGPIYGGGGSSFSGDTYTGDLIEETFVFDTTRGNVTPTGIEGGIDYGGTSSPVIFASVTINRRRIVSSFLPQVAGNYPVYPDSGFSIYGSQGSSFGGPANYEGHSGGSTFYATDTFNLLSDSGFAYFAPGVNAPLSLIPFNTFAEANLTGVTIRTFSGDLEAAPGPIPGSGLLSYIALALLGLGSYGWKRLRLRA